MRKQILATATLCMLLTSLYAMSDVKNPALNPVTFQPPTNKNPLSLISNGKADFAIVADLDSENIRQENRRSVHIAVELLKEAFKNTAVLDLPVISPDSKKELSKYKYWLVVGNNSISRKFVNTGKLPVENFEVVTFKNGIVIAGEDGVATPGGYNKLDGGRYRINGTAWGAIDFIERFLGVRYYFPGPGIVWPKIESLSIEPVKYRDAPRFNSSRWRWDKWGEFGRQTQNWPKEWKDYQPDWQKFFNYWREADVSRLIVAHTPAGHHWAGVHLKSKPELFYKDKYGKIWADPNDSMGTVFDISNKETARQYIQDCKKFYDTGWNNSWKGWYPPSCESIAFGQSDRYMVIENERTQGLLDYSRGKFGTMSDVNARFYIWLAEMAQQELPGKKIVGWAYADYRLPPLKKWNFPKNFEFVQCNINHVCFYGKKDILDFDINLVKTWNNILGKRVGSQLYFIQSGGFPEVVSPEYSQLYLQKADPYLRQDLVYYGKSDWGVNFMTNYLMQRLYWHPDFNLNAAREESYKLLYGKAAPYVKQFYELIFKRWKENYLPNSPKFNAQKPEMLQIDNSVLYQKAFPPQIIRELKTYLADACKAVPKNSIEHRRLSFLEKSWEKNFKNAEKFSSFSRPTYKVNQREGNIRIDGKLDESTWKNANIFVFKNAKDGNQAACQSQGMVLWDSDGLYIGLELPENNVSNLKKKAVARDGNVWDDDGIEIFLSPGTDKAEYAQVGINASGIVADGHKRLKPEITHLVPNWNWDGMKAATTVSQNKWSVEMFLPFKGIGAEPPKKYSVWYGNFIRNKQTEPTEHTSFSQTMGDNHNINYFGMLKFMGRKL